MNPFKEQKIKCEVCGDLRFVKNMFLYDGQILCRSCFIKDKKVRCVTWH